MKTTKWKGMIRIGFASAMVLTIGLALLLCGQVRSGSNGSAGTGKGSEASDYELSGPYTHRNLTVFLIYGANKINAKNFLTLQEALAQKKVVVFETKSVNELAIQNLSNQEVYVQSGDIVMGGQQHRMLAVDLIVPPHSGKIPIAAFWVESCRWTRRGN